MLWGWLFSKGSNMNKPSKDLKKHVNTSLAMANILTIWPYLSINYKITLRP